MLNAMAESIGIIGDSDNQRPDEWSSTVLIVPKSGDVTWQYT